VHLVQPSLYFSFTRAVNYNNNNNNILLRGVLFILGRKPGRRNLVCTFPKGVSRHAATEHQDDLLGSASPELPKAKPPTTDQIKGSKSSLQTKVLWAKVGSPVRRSASIHHHLKYQLPS